MDRDQFEHRLAVIFGVVVTLFAILAIRLWQVQIVQGDYFARLAEENRLRVTPLSAPRGLIVDRAGRPIVENRPAFTVAVLPLEFLHPAQEIPVVARLLAIDPGRGRPAARGGSRPAVRAGPAAPGRVRRRSSRPSRRAGWTCPASSSRWSRSDTTRTTNSRRT